MAEARRVKALARGHPIVEGGRAVAVAFTGSGDVAPESWIVRFEILRRQDPRRRLADAFAQTGAAAFWYFGGDPVARRAVAALDFESAPRLGVFVRCVEPSNLRNGIDLRQAGDLDFDTRMLVTRHVAGFLHPRFAAAMRGDERVGFAVLEELTERWSEVSGFVYPSLRRRGYGARILAQAADATERTGRKVCAAVPVEDEPARATLERAGFRLADYYFLATPPTRLPLV
ncbi:MAG: GNAT family N-acetyltransferase [Candidatus Eremiobacteraeota bacterium]|nr:GNAT family N-acetyltransferase [Candidatus Eremiobacteraeota bacterium]